MTYPIATQIKTDAAIRIKAAAALPTEIPIIAPKPRMGDETVVGTSADGDVANAMALDGGVGELLIGKGISEVTSRNKVELPLHIG